MAVPLGRLCTLLVAFAIGLATLSATGGGQDVDPQTALTEGNRLFREGQLEEALEAYRGGYSPGLPHPTLLYNLGTTLHHLDRLPEAILWYRRARSTDDAWLAENLWLARRSLGSQQLPPGGLFGWLGGHTVLLKLVAVLLSWATLVLLLAWSRAPFWLPAGTFVLAALVYGGALAAERWGPHPAVLLEDCITTAGEVPAGTEAWVSRGVDGGWSLSGTHGAVCPPESVELVFPTP
jgi:tetratricopeptide (TPR) repeat protein